MTTRMSRTPWLIRRRTAPGGRPPGKVTRRPASGAATRRAQPPEHEPADGEDRDGARHETCRDHALLERGPASAAGGDRHHRGPGPPDTAEERHQPAAIEGVDRAPEGQA